MDAEELKNLKKYLYILCEKIGKIQRSTGKDKKDEFLKEYKLCFLLFVHKIYEYRSSLALSDEEDAFKAIPLIKEINKLYKEKITDAKSPELVEAERLLKEENIVKLIKDHNELKQRHRTINAKNLLGKFENDNNKELKNIKDANETIKKARKESDIDKTIDSLLSRILGKTTGMELISETDLNKQLYGNTGIEPNTDMLKIIGEIDGVKALLNNDRDLSIYYSFINKIIHNINPNISTSTDVKVKEYVNKYFKAKSVGDKDDNEDLKIRKAFMIYLINNVIYYYIILKYDEAPCDVKIRFIFDNRYIKFSNIEMVAPQTNDQYTVLNKDIIGIFKEGTHLFDLMNNILEYEHHYLLTCEDYNKSIAGKGKVEAEDEEEYKNEPALQKYNELSEDYNKAYQGYVSSFKAYETTKAEYAPAKLEYLKADIGHTEANGIYLELLNKKDANAKEDAKKKMEVAKNKMEDTKNKMEVAKKKMEGAGEALRSAVYTFNELLFCCFCKYIEINFKNRIDKLTAEYKEKISKYLALIKTYNEKCNNCQVNYNEGNYEDALNLLTKVFKKVIDHQVNLLLKANKSVGKNAMNGIINTVIEIERRLEDIYKAFYENPHIFLSVQYNRTKPLSNNDKDSLEYEYVIKKKDPLTMTYSQVMELIIKKLKTAGYKNADILSIYTTLKDIVDNKIKIKYLTFDEIKKCCLDDDFMNRETFVVDDDTGILALIYSEAIEKSFRLIKEYKEAHGKSDTTNDNASVKIEAYIKLIEDINGVEQEAQKKKIDALNLLKEARKKATEAFNLTQKSKVDIDTLSSLIDTKIRIVKDYLKEEEERFQRYERIKTKFEESNITFDSVSIRNDRISQIDESERKIRNIRDKKNELNGLIDLANSFAITAQQKAYNIKEVYRLNTLNTIDGIKERLTDAISTAGTAILHNENAMNVYDEIENLLREIDPDIIIINGLTRYIRERQELQEIKRVADDSVKVVIDVGKAIASNIEKQEESEAEEEAEIKPVKVKRRIDEEYVKGNYLYPGLFNEVKEDDLKAIREYHAEQVRNKFRAKPGAIAKMDAEIDKYNYQQSGGGTGGNADDMIKRLNNFENDINNPIEAFEIKFEDRLVFIITTFFLRYISISIIQRGIDSNMVKTFYEGFIYYGVIYILLFWFIVLFINIDNNYTIDYIDVNNLAIYIRSVFYYFYMGTNGISRLVIHSLLILLIIIIPIILNIKNTKARDMLNEDDEDEVKLLSLEERTKLSKALSLFTLFIWILTSIIASKF